ncbi:hypothetical protein AX17_005839 [Amanita inopinata Kibby_2008]|nr:hypothetical protein AX17_005839 [Amanita inopinata Kibby_2008]
MSSSSKSAPQKVSFTIRRPTPISRTASPGGDSDSSGFKLPSLPRHLRQSNDSKPSSPLARSATSSPDHSSITAYYDENLTSSDEEFEQIQDELVTSFDQFAVQRSNKKRNSDSGPLVIPALQDRDWRAVARKRRSVAQFVPASSQEVTGKDGSVGGLGTRDSINAGPVLAGLQIKKETAMEVEVEAQTTGEARDSNTEEKEESEDQRALRAVLASADGIETEGSAINIIPVHISESDALKQDIEELPDVATLEDYARVPVSQFGAAMLRGMGWKEGTAASRKAGKGLAEPYLPQARPALLGIGAKERERFDDGSKRNKSTRPERKYVPVIRKEREDTPASGNNRRERSRSPKHQSATTSRRSSRSPSRRKDLDRDQQRRDSDRDRRDRDHADGRERVKSRDREQNRERDRLRDRDSRRYDSDKERSEKDRWRDH